MGVYKNDVYASKDSSKSSSENFCKYIIEKELKSRETKKCKSEPPKEPQNDCCNSCVAPCECNSPNTYWTGYNFIDNGRCTQGMKRFESSYPSNSPENIPIPPPGYCGERCKCCPTCNIKPAAPCVNAAFIKRCCCSVSAPTPVLEPTIKTEPTTVTAPKAYGHFYLDNSETDIAEPIYILGDVAFNKISPYNLNVESNGTELDRIYVREKGIYKITATLRTEEAPQATSYLSCRLNDEKDISSKLKIFAGENVLQFITELKKDDFIKLNISEQVTVPKEYSVSQLLELL